MAQTKTKSAANIRSKITQFDFADTARANIRTAGLLGTVASVMEKKTEEQNENFDRLLKMLEWLPKDFMERRTQQRAMFGYLAKLTATVERQAETETDPNKKIALEDSAKELRRQGKRFDVNEDTSNPRNIKEAFAKRVLKISPEQLRAGGGVFGAYKDEFSRITGLFNKKGDDFGNRVEQEKQYPELFQELQDTISKSRTKGKVPEGPRRTTTPKTTTGVAPGILTKMYGELVKIRLILSPNMVRHTEVTKDEPPKGLFSEKEKDYFNPKYWGVKKKGPQKGRKYWNKRGPSGKLLKPGETEPEIPDTPPDIMDRMKNLEPKTDTKFASSGEEDIKPTEDNKESPESGGGNILGSIVGMFAGAEGAAAIAAIIEDALPIVLGAVLTAATLSLIVAGVTNHLPDWVKKLLGIQHDTSPAAMHDEGLTNWGRGFGVQLKGRETPKQLDDIKKQTEKDIEEWKRDGEFNTKYGEFDKSDYLESVAKRHGFKSGKDMMKNHLLERIEQPKADVSSTLVEKANDSETSDQTTVIAPSTINNITNINGGGGSKAPMPSVRSTDNSRVRYEDKRQSRIW